MDQRQRLRICAISDGQAVPYFTFPFLSYFCLGTMVDNDMVSALGEKIKHMFGKQWKDMKVKVLVWTLKLRFTQ